jgi:L-2,4-diaminobutyrate decarboxylase
MAVELWACLRALGPGWFGDVFDRLVDRASELATKLARAGDFEVALPPESNIVCFRHTPAGVRDLDAHNRALRARAIADGTYYIVGTELGGSYYLRTTIMNALTEPRDLEGLVEYLRGLCPP